MEHDKIVNFSITPKDDGTFDVHEGPLLVGNFPTEDAAKEALELAKERHK